MAIINCPECGNNVSDQAESCPHCGNRIMEAVSEQKPAKKKDFTKIKKKLPIILTAIAGIVLAVAVGISVRIIDGKIMKNGQENLATMRAELASVSSELTSAKKDLDDVNKKVKSQSDKITPLTDIYDVSLASGLYTVGQDIEPGIYHLTYKIRNPKGYNWGDSIYVTYADSTVSEDDLYGSDSDFEVLAEEDGEEVLLKLDAGSKVFVETNFGNWVASQQTTTTTAQ